MKIPNDTRKSRKSATSHHVVYESPNPDPFYSHLSSKHVQYRKKEKDYTYHDQISGSKSKNNAVFKCLSSIKKRVMKSNVVMSSSSRSTYSTRDDQEYGNRHFSLRSQHDPQSSLDCGVSTESILSCLRMPAFDKSRGTREPMKQYNRRTPVDDRYDIENNIIIDDMETSA
eukprot:Awhi_evm1s15698